MREVDAPDGAEAVDWMPLTTEPVETREQIEAVIDAYRARWRIEELFKALKTGCAFEKRQLEPLPTLLNALAVFTPIAVHLLTLRTMANEASESPAADVLNPVQLRILERHENTRLRPTLPPAKRARGREVGWPHQEQRRPGMDRPRPRPTKSSWPSKRALAPPASPEASSSGRTPSNWAALRARAA